MHLRKRLAAITALALGAGAVGLSLTPAPAAATAPAPVVLNDGGQNGSEAQWAETQEAADDGAVDVFVATFLVQHAVGRTINNVRLDANLNGTDDTTNAAFNVAVTGQTFVASNGDGIETSRVTVSTILPRPSGFSCPVIGGATREVDAPVRARVVDSTGEVSATTLTTTVKFIEDSNCLARQDFVRLTGASQSDTEVVPGEDINYTFTCDDVDSPGGSDDECDRGDFRWRRLDDGVTGSLNTQTTLDNAEAIDDNSSRTLTVDLPSQGHYVIEARFLNEDGSCRACGGAPAGWWRLGNAVVNDASSSLSGSIAFTGAAASIPPSLNESTTVDATATATVADSGGKVQAIEWDADGNGVFERSEYTVPSAASGDIVHPDLTSDELKETVDLNTPGLKTIQARITDNGALDAADTIRRQLTFSQPLRVNDLPTASNRSHTVNEDSGTGTITLLGTDADAQPAPLEYSTVSGLSNPSLGSLGALNTSTGAISFTPAANAFGTATFTYRVRDGNVSTVGANGFSNTATVTITVNSINDLPVLDGKSITTTEDNAGSVLMTGTDVEDGVNLTYTVDSQPLSGTGTASCSAITDVCTYTPPLNFNGSTSFIVRGSDTQGGSTTTTVPVSVTAVNDAPVANSQTVTVGEDATNFGITLSGSDVDNLILSFTAPLDDVDHGTLSCLGSSCTYSPTADYNGPDSFTFKVSDGSLDSNVATVTIDVVAVNDGPVATDVPDAEADEDIPEAIAATGTDVDAGDVVTVASATDPANGTTSVTGANEVTYQGDLNFHGLDTFDFEVTDGDASDIGTVSVTVHPVNDAPVIDPQAFTLDEDTPTLLSIAAGDVDGDLLTWSVTGGATNGTVFGTGPDVVYVPDANYHGSDTFTVQVSDGLLTASATMTVTVTSVNDQPVANAAATSTNEDNSVDVTLTGEDLADGDPLTFLIGSTPSNGSVVCSGDLCTYTPTPDFHGSDLFTFIVSDGSATDEASISITVSSINDDPVAAGGSVTTAEDTSVAIPLSATDVDGDALTFAYGTATIGVVSGGGPDAVYTPNPNANGPDAFGFTVDDGHGGTDSEVVAVQVDAVNDAPVPTGGTVATPEDTDVSFSLGATDVEEDALLFGITSPPDSGALTCDGAGACLYDPDEDFSGSVTAEYSVFDGADSSTGTVTIVVDPVNDLPVPVAGSVATAEDTAVGFDLSANDSEGDALTFAVVSAPTNGTVVCSTGGSCTYTPAQNSDADDSFTWSVSDGGPSVNSTTSIDVLPVNDAPLALDVSQATNEDTPVAVTLLASDAEGDPITYTVESLPGAGSVLIAGNVATYTPTTDYSGTDSFTYRATDPSGAFTTARVSLVVNEVPLIGTNLVGDAAVAQVQVTLAPGNVHVVVFPNLRATLRTSSGAPLAGRTITFSVGGVAICSATTNAQGAGTCSAQIPLLRSLLNLGYQVSFAGDLDYSASTARGPLVQVLQLRL